MVAKTAVVCMLLNCHQLDAVVAQSLYSGQDLICKLTVLCDPPVDRAHAYMRFVNLQSLGLSLDSFILKYMPLVRVKEDAVKKPALVVLTDEGRPGGVAVRFVVVGLSNLYFVSLPMLDERYTCLRFESGRPDTKLIALAQELFTVPVVEITKLRLISQGNRLTIESDFAAGAHSR